MGREPGPGGLAVDFFEGLHAVALKLAGVAELSFDVGLQGFGFLRLLGFRGGGRYRASAGIGNAAGGEAAQQGEYAQGSHRQDSRGFRFR